MKKVLLGLICLGTVGCASQRHNYKCTVFCFGVRPCIEVRYHNITKKEAETRSNTMLKLLQDSNKLSLKSVVTCEEEK